MRCSTGLLGTARSTGADLQKVSRQTPLFSLPWHLGCSELLRRATDPELSRIDVWAAIGAASAKLWIRESLSLSTPTEDLAVARWTANARKGIEFARMGLIAPKITKFEVKGAHIDPYGHEVVPADKIRRHYQIHHYGFS